MFSFEDLMSALQSVELSRSVLDISNPETVILTGVPEKFSAVKNRLEAAGFVVHGCIDPFDQADLGIPSYSLKHVIPDLPLVFAGRPSKQWFNGVSKQMSRVFWFDPPGHNHQKMAYDPDFVINNYHALLRLYNDLADDESKSVLLSIVKARFSGDAGYYLTADYAEYDHPTVKPLGGDIVIDAGAFDGDTAEQFSRAVGEQGRVISIEASEHNFHKLCIRVAEQRLLNVIPVFGAVWSDMDLLNFSGSVEASSMITKSGKDLVPAFTIDSLVDRLSLPKVDLIKMDIEGVEKDCLLGSVKTISKHLPKLQISAYHKNNDLWEIKDFLQSTFEDRYRFYLGHHNYYHTETDLYCVKDV